MNFLINSIVAIHSTMPLWLNRIFGCIYGTLLFILNPRLRKTTLTNLQLCKPTFSSVKIFKIAYLSCLHTGMTISEAFYIWNRPFSKTLSKISITDDEQLLELNNKNNGIIFVSAHIGCWELLSNLIGHHRKCNALFRETKNSTFNQIMTKGRSQTNVTMHDGATQSIRKILKGLQNGEATLIIADQEPKTKKGIFVPLFQNSAYTSVLPYKLCRSSKALGAFIIVNRNITGWSVVVDPFDMRSQSSEEDSATTMNKNFEKYIDKHLSQWEWGYKRFKTQPTSDRNIYPF